jgi:hypothetical protein
MRHAKLFGIALLAAMVSVGCGQAPTMNADVSGYGGYKYGKKMSGSEVNQVNVISDLHFGHKIEQDQEIDQEQNVDQSNESTQAAAAASGGGNASATAGGGVPYNGATQPTLLPIGGGDATAVNVSEQSNEAEQKAEQEQSAVIVGDIKDIEIKQSNNIGTRSFDRKNSYGSKKYDRKDRFEGND